MFRLFRSRSVWLAIGVFTLAGTAFWIVFAAVAAIMSTAAGGADPDEVARVAVPLGMLAALAAAVLGIAAVVAVRRGRVRQWVPLREQMVRDAATLPGTHLAQVVSAANSAAGGQVLARDLITGHKRPLWLPGWNMPRGAVVSFRTTPSGPRVRAWMTGQLWRVTSREAARIERRTTKAYAAANVNRTMRLSSRSGTRPARRSPRPSASCGSTSPAEASQPSTRQDQSSGIGCCGGDASLLRV